MAWIFEHKSQPLLPRRAFLSRLGLGVLAAAVLILGALVLGAIGYRSTEGMPWLDAFLNASMILTGMGPVDRVETAPGKLFAIFYCLMSGFVVLTAGALILGPILHRLLHVFHLDEDGDTSA